MTRRVSFVWAPLWAMAVWLAAAGCEPVVSPPASEAPLARVAATSAAGEAGPIVQHLENGLTVIVQPWRAAPVVCVRAYVRAGGLYEREWLGCGLSHLCEHLMAQEAVHEMPGGGAPHGGQEKHARTLEIGGQSNAYTSQDHTCYYISAAADKALACVDLIAEQVQRVDIAPEDFRREHGVVQRELEMGKDNANRLMWYAHAANVFRTHPAAVPVIGWAKPLSRVTREDVLAYVRRMYVPQNMVFVVVGDVDAAAVLQRVRRAFAGATPGRQPDLTLPEVPAFAGVRRRTVRTPKVHEAVQQMSFQTIPLLHEDLYALDVLSYILSKGRSSRLVRSLQFERSLVTQISTSSWTPAWGRGVFTVSFRAAPDKADAAEQAAGEMLRAVVADGVTAAELARAKRQKRAELVYARQTAESLAGNLASDYLSTGDVRFSKHYVDGIEAVTAEQVQDVARRYFDFDRMAITRMVPADSAAAPTAAGAAAVEAGATEMIRLPNGLRVLLHSRPEAGLVSMVLASTGGVLVEDEATNGLGALMTALTTRGAGQRTGEQIAAFFDAAGGGIAGRCGSNTFYWRATVLADRFEPALEIFADVIQRPTFPAEELERMRPLLLASIRRIDEDWRAQLMRVFRGAFFTSPYRLDPAGRLEVVGQAGRDDLVRWHREHVRAGSSVLAVYGSFDAATARQRIERLFADLPAGATPVPDAPRPEVPAGGKLKVVNTRNVQAGVAVAAPGMRVANTEDRAAIDVLDTIISGYHLPSGWLHTELRGKRLVYVVHAYNWAGLVPGAFLTYAGCQPDKAPEVVRIIRKNLRRAAAYTPTEHEVKRAVNVILTAEALQSQTMSDQAMQAALDELYGLGHDWRRKLAAWYGAVTPAEVRRVGEKYLSGPLHVVVTTPQPGAFGASEGEETTDDTEEQ